MRRKQPARQRARWPGRERKAPGFGWAARASKASTTPLTEQLKRPFARGLPVYGGTAPSNRFTADQVRGSHLIYCYSRYNNIIPSPCLLAAEAFTDFQVARAVGSGGQPAGIRCRALFPGRLFVGNTCRTERGRLFYNKAIAWQRCQSVFKLLLGSRTASNHSFTSGAAVNAIKLLATYLRSSAGACRISAANSGRVSSTYTISSQS